MASGGEERRGKLRKAPGICKQEMIRRCLNGATRPVEDRSPTYCWGERGELKHLSTPRRRKKAIDVRSSGDRTGQSPNRGRFGGFGVVGVIIRSAPGNWNVLESTAVAGDSPLQVTGRAEDSHLSRAGHVESCLNPRGPSRKAKYSRKTDSEPVP